MSSIPDNVLAADLRIYADIMCHSEFDTEGMYAAKIRAAADRLDRRIPSEEPLEKDLFPPLEPLTICNQELDELKADHRALMRVAYGENKHLREQLELEKEKNSKLQAENAELKRASCSAWLPIETAPKARCNLRSDGDGGGEL
jgi:hypothetical protein